VEFDVAATVGGDGVEFYEGFGGVGDGEDAELGGCGGDG
jgi:hypothetical protein